MNVSNSYFENKIMIQEDITARKLLNVELLLANESIQYFIYKNINKSERRQLLKEKIIQILNYFNTFNTIIVNRYSRNVSDNLKYIYNLKFDFIYKISQLKLNDNYDNFNKVIDLYIEYFKNNIKIFINEVFINSTKCSIYNNLLYGDIKYIGDNDQEFIFMCDTQIIIQNDIIKILKNDITIDIKVKTINIIEYNMDDFVILLNQKYEIKSKKVY